MDQGVTSCVENAPARNQRKRSDDGERKTYGFIWEPPLLIRVEGVNSGPREPVSCPTTEPVNDARKPRSVAAG
ncbi:hypothetical protein B296_00034567 [Ensete ventricosum]|uniref:Uncharacterized protein n=1 Tax=Ensete ventricosum TaxID=4639 RepID=A0A427A833_ENSVE|nr:hypothetical protein B296_00034567 [Ensete ventricosum]